MDKTKLTELFESLRDQKSSRRFNDLLGEMPEEESRLYLEVLDVSLRRRLSLDKAMKKVTERPPMTKEAFNGLISILAHNVLALRLALEGVQSLYRNKKRRKLCDGVEDLKDYGSLEDKYALEPPEMTCLIDVLDETIEFADKQFVSASTIEPEFVPEVRGKLRVLRMALRRFRRGVDEVCDLIEYSWETLNTLESYYFGGHGEAVC